MNNDQMQAAFEECAARHSAHLIDLVVRGSHSRPVIEVFIDAKDGVTSELCAEVSRDVAETIDRERWVRGTYRLDVSSPGIDRPLRFPWQYPKHLGRVMDVYAAGIDAPYVGELTFADDNGIVLQLLEGASALRLTFEAIKMAIVRAPW
jgi:ribosome maturation factor RimP